MNTTILITLSDTDDIKYIINVPLSAHQYKQVKDFSEHSGLSLENSIRRLVEIALV